jgi:hypothetical protein
LYLTPYTIIYNLKIVDVIERKIKKK